jgi:hypothetical protein
MKTAVKAFGVCLILSTIVATAILYGLFEPKERPHPGIFAIISLFGAIWLSVFAFMLSKFINNFRMAVSTGEEGEGDTDSRYLSTQRSVRALPGIASDRTIAIRNGLFLGLLPVVFFSTFLLLFGRSFLFDEDGLNMFFVPGIVGFIGFAAVMFGTVRYFETRSNLAGARRTVVAFEALADEVDRGVVERGKTPLWGPTPVSLNFSHRGKDAHVTTDSSAFTTRIAFESDLPLTDEVYVHSRHSHYSEGREQPEEFQDETSIVTAFERSFEVRTEDEEAMQNLINSDVQKTLLALRQWIKSGHVTLKISDDTLDIAISGHVSDAVELKEFHGFATRLYDQVYTLGRVSFSSKTDLVSILRTGKRGAGHRLSWSQDSSMKVEITDRQWRQYRAFWVVIGGLMMLLGLCFVALELSVLSWSETTGRLVSANVRSETSFDGGEMSTSYTFYMTYTYEAEGSEYEGSRYSKTNFGGGARSKYRSLEEYLPVGYNLGWRAYHPIRHLNRRSILPYNPMDPEESVLTVEPLGTEKSIPVRYNPMDPEESVLTVEPLNGFLLMALGLWYCSYGLGVCAKSRRGYLAFLALSIANSVFIITALITIFSALLSQIPILGAVFGFIPEFSVSFRETVFWYLAGSWLLTLPISVMIALRSQEATSTHGETARWGGGRDISRNGCLLLFVCVPCGGAFLLTNIFSLLSL